MKKLFYVFLLFSFITLLSNAMAKSIVKTELITKVDDEIWAIEFISNNEILFTQKHGKLSYLNLDNNEVKNIKNIPSVNYRSQGGLLDLALDYNFAENNIIYFSYSASTTNKENQLIVAKAIFNKKSYALENIKTILAVTPLMPLNKHHGGRIVVADKDTLIISVSERDAKYPSQDTSNILGTIIRIKTDGSVPTDNPFVKNKNFNPLIYSYGHRNIQGLTIYNGEIYINEHGPKGGDKVTKIVKGANYGWPLVTYGTDYDGTSIGTGKPIMEGIEDAYINLVPSPAPSDLIYYEYDIYPELKNKFLMTTLKYQSFYALDIVKHQGAVKIENVATKVTGIDLGRLRSIAISNDGYIYLGNTNGIYKLLP